MKPFFNTAKSKAVPFMMMLVSLVGYSIDHRPFEVTETGKAVRPADSEWNPYKIVSERIKQMEEDTFGQKALLLRYQLKNASESLLKDLEFRIKDLLKDQEKLYNELKGIKEWTQKTASDPQKELIDFAVQEANERVAVCLELAVRTSRQLTDLIKGQVDSSLPPSLPAKMPTSLKQPKAPVYEPRLFPRIRQFIEPK